MSRLDRLGFDTRTPADTSMDQSSIPQGPDNDLPTLIPINFRTQIAQSYTLICVAERDGAEDGSRTRSEE
ncbi:hypothetical protein L6452_33260 [Arctium lappa]|uniref:Uncharacterized protein n=1 Tax=Arctium lappa TaxID=4217 RepID=A0ACB8Z6T0_ARCLA|nr:hypothetical protein L6452_33260 [Arctium lappa]